MATLVTLGLNKEKLVFNEKGWANITISINDDTNQYGQNASASISQTKEQRGASPVSEKIKTVWH